MANGLLGDEAQTGSKEATFMVHDKGLSDNKHSKPQLKTDSVFKNQNKPSHSANNNIGNNTLNQFDAKKNPEPTSEFDNLILKDKPLVSWNEVVGLEDAGLATRDTAVRPPGMRKNLACSGCSR